MKLNVFGIASLFACPLAYADAAPTAKMVDSVIEIAWNEQAPQRTRIALALPEAHGCSTMELDQDHREIKLSACRVGGDASTPVLEISLERIDRADRSGSLQPTSHTRVKATVRLARGVPMTIGRFDRDQRPTEVIASLR